MSNYRALQFAGSEYFAGSAYKVEDNGNQYKDEAEEYPYGWLTPLASEVQEQRISGIEQTYRQIHTKVGIEDVIFFSN